jgi:hypothetical protein
MLRVRKAVRDYDQGTSVQHQVAIKNLVNCNVFHDSFQQGCLVRFSGQVDRRPPEDSLKIGHAIFAMMKLHGNAIIPMDNIGELDEKYLGCKPRFEQAVTHARGEGYQ